MEIDMNKITSNDPEILKRSLEIIDEHLEKESKRGELAEKRAAMLIPFMTIGSALILAFSKVIGSMDATMSVLINMFFIITIIYFVKAALYTLVSFKATQANRLSPDMVNDIQEYTINQALAYEVKWKIWEYNKMVPVNTERLFYVFRAQNNLMLAVFSVLFLSFIQYLSQFITYQSATFISIQSTIGSIGIIFAIFSDVILEKFSFWEFK